ncbi:transposase [Rhodothermaceae bacterium RA]|nr:transposase [Rhodothermaceae bacterium RA]
MGVNRTDYRRTRHAVHAVKYHFVFCPKRRRRVLVGAVAKRLRQIIEEVAAENEWEIIKLAILPDHVHLFLQADTRHAPYQVVRAFKSRSSRILRDEYPCLLRLPSLWTRSYFCSTNGRVSEETVKRYIEEQS